MLTDESGRVLETESSGDNADPEVVRRARQIAARLSLRRPHLDLSSRRGAGTLASVRYRGASDEIDIDATLAVLVERPVPEEDDIVVRERVRALRSVVLAVDISGSMRGERIRSAAATVGALAAELARDHLAVLAFWSDAAMLSPLTAQTSPTLVLDLMMSMRARGLTNVSFPLELAQRALAAVATQDAHVVLLSDCVHNAGPDPRVIAARLPRLDVLLDTSGEHDLPLARDLARLGRGRLARAGNHRAIGAALSSLFR